MVLLQKKDEFIKQKLEERGSTDSPDDESIGPEELSIFYKQFLDDNYNTHKQYNKYVLMSLCYALSK